ncbi:MAG: ankyrin repeat domain-containing protein [Bacteroidota bacterium]
MSGGDWKQMFKAIQENDIELVSYYLQSGIDPNYQHPEYMALPLSESIRYNHKNIAQLLVKSGAETSIIEMESGLTAFDLAEKMGRSNFLNIGN